MANECNILDGFASLLVLEKVNNSKIIIKKPENAY